MIPVVESVYDKLRGNRFQWSRHSHLLPTDEQRAYQEAGGGAAGRRAVLTMAGGGTTELERLKAYWIARYRFEASRALRAVDRDRRAIDGSPAALAWSAGYDDAHAAMLDASAAYKEATGEPIPAPPTPAHAAQWRDEALA
jgi:hypothetical protein